MATAETQVTIRRLGNRAIRLGGNLWRRLASFPGLVVRLVRVAGMRRSGTSDVQRWTGVDNLEPWWEERTRLLAAMIPAHASVIEFGAGRRRLEAYLAPGTRYVPSDLVDRGPGTVVCDLNERPLPDLRGLGLDVAVFSGVFEYLADVPTIVDWLSSSVTHVVASYACVPVSASARRREYLERMKNGYLSHFTEDELVAVFRARGFAPVQTAAWQSQRLFVFTRQFAARSTQGNGTT